MVIPSWAFKTNWPGVKKAVHRITFVYRLSSCNLEWWQKVFHSVTNMPEASKITKQKSRNMRKGTEFFHVPLLVQVSCDALKALVSCTVKKNQLVLEKPGFPQQKAKHIYHSICSGLIWTICWGAFLLLSVKRQCSYNGLEGNSPVLSISNFPSIKWP